MSLTISLQSALASLQATQGAMQVVSNNVANATTEGYSRKTVNTQTQIVAGRASGVRLTDIQRTVDDNLVRQIRVQLSKVSDLGARNEYFERIQQLFGSPGSNSDVGHILTELGTAVEALSTSAESATGKHDMVSVAIQMTERLNSLSRDIQSMRREVDRNIADAVSTINTKLATVHDLNGQISAAVGQQQPTADLEDARDTVLAQLSELIEIETFERANGQVVVFTSSGRPLIDNGTQTLAHTPAAQYDATVTYPARIPGILYGAGALDITSELTSGKLGGMIEMRDQRLVALQQEFDRLSESLANAANAAHNAGTAFPPPSSLTSSRSFAANDAPGMSGNFRVSIVDTSGTVIETADIALGGLASIGALATAIDGMTNATAGLNAQGQLSIAATGGYRVAINELDSSVTAGSQTTGLSQFLGLNDLFTTTTDYAAHTSDHVASATTALGLTGTLSFAYPGGTANVAYAAGDSLTALAANINAALGGQNVTATVVQENGKFRLNIDDADGDNLFVTDSSNLTTTLNLRAGGPGTAATIGVRDEIVADPNLVSTGELSADPALAAGDYGISSGDNAALDALASVFANDQTISAAGGLPLSTMRLADYAASIVSLNSTQAADVSAQFEVQDSYKLSLETMSANISQVNIDEEMSNLMILQNAYQASARITQTVSDMMDVLINIIR